MSNRTLGLFPSMDRELAENRIAQAREDRQRAIEFLRKNPGYEKWIIKSLTEKGPQVDANMVVEMAELVDGDFKATWMAALPVASVLFAMWKDRRLWRVEFPNHPCGAICYLYGIRGVHTKPDRK